MGINGLAPEEGLHGESWKKRGKILQRGRQVRAFQAERATHAEARGQESAGYAQELPAV